MMMVEDSTMESLSCAGRASQTASSERVMMEGNSLDVGVELHGCLPFRVSASRHLPVDLSHCRACRILSYSPHYFIENSGLVQKNHSGINRAATRRYQRQPIALAGASSPQMPHNQARQAAPTSSSPPRFTPAAVPVRQNNTRNAPRLESFRGLERVVAYV